MIILRKKEEMEKYYVEAVNTYVFKEDVFFFFDINVEANIDVPDIIAHDIKACKIKANNINARNIEANNINAWNIEANNIKANDILYFAVCFAYKNIECNTIKGRRENSRHFVLDGELIVGRNK